MRTNARRCASRAAAARTAAFADDGRTFHRQAQPGSGGLDRIGIQGHEGEIQIKPPHDEDEDETPIDEKDPEPSKGVGPSGTLPDRHIYCLDLRDSNRAEVFLDEIRRILAECRTRQEQKDAVYGVLS